METIHPGLEIVVVGIEFIEALEIVIASDEIVGQPKAIKIVLGHLEGECRAGVAWFMPNVLPAEVSERP